MSGRLVFITGGARSGKSDFAMTLAEKAGGELIYVATAAAGDEEMAERIERHRKSRGSTWFTVEEQLDLVKAVGAFGGPEHTILVDCLTLWLSNIMMSEGEGFERAAREKALSLAALLKGYGGSSFVVSNEVGMGIVPDNPSARRFRDMAGTVNRIMAEAADEVYMVVSGLPIKVKP